MSPILPLTKVTPRPEDGKAVPGGAELELCCHPTYVKLNYLKVTSEECGDDTIFPSDEPFNVEAQIEFYGPGALALMALKVPMQFTFTAESLGPGPELNILTVNTTTNQGVLVYTVGGTVPANTLIGDIIYRISMHFRLGVVGPKLTLGNGYISGITVEAFNS
jgi:hypothetical protein